MSNRITQPLLFWTRMIPKARLVVVSWLALILITVALQGCGPVVDINALDSVELIPEPPPGGPADFDFAFAVNGIGKCDSLKMDWGDGNIEFIPNYDLTQKTPIFHKFAGWSGGKTITAIGFSGCIGTAQTKIDVAPGRYNIAFAAGPTTCDPVPNKPNLAGPRTLIHIMTIPVTGTYSFGIDFGCPAGGCRYNADGKPGSSAPSRFPFPGLREFSLVIRIGTEIFQGGTNVQFTATQAAPLEVCLNDDNLADNHGGYEIVITTDQLGPVLTSP